MRSRFAEAAQVWLVGDRITASGDGRAIACPKLEGAAAFQVFARFATGTADLEVAIETGPSDAGPWTELASIASSGSVAERVAVAADRLDEYVRATYAIDGTATINIAAALIGDSKYPEQAAATGADDITGDDDGSAGDSASLYPYQDGLWNNTIPVVEADGTVHSEWIVDLETHFDPHTQGSDFFTIDLFAVRSAFDGDAGFEVWLEESDDQGDEDPWAKITDAGYSKAFTGSSDNFVFRPPSPGYLPTFSGRKRYWRLGVGNFVGPLDGTWLLRAEMVSICRRSIPEE